MRHLKFSFIGFAIYGTNQFYKNEKDRLVPFLEVKQSITLHSPTLLTLQIQELHHLSHLKTKNQFLQYLHNTSYSTSQIRRRLCISDNKIFSYFLFSKDFLIFLFKYFKIFKGFRYSVPSKKPQTEKDRLKPFFETLYFSPSNPIILGGIWQSPKLFSRNYYPI